MSEAADLYETDFSRWAEQQAEALRTARATGANLPLDWNNLAEEIESLGRSQRRELRSRLDTIIEHLLKLQFSPALAPRESWESTVARERRDIEALLDDNRSLRPEIGPILSRSAASVAKFVAAELVRRGEISADAADALKKAGYAEDQVLGDWWPADPAA